MLEELGTYDPLVPETDARAVLNGERIDYWLSVGAQPSDKVGVLIKKYGAEGTHLEAQRLALARLAQGGRPPAADAAAREPTPAAQRRTGGSRAGRERPPEPRKRRPKNVR